MKVFVTGVNGQLGHDVMNELAKRGISCMGSDIASAYTGIQDDTAVTVLPYEQLDITDAVAVRDVFEKFQPDAVVHCAAWTAVDAAEDPENRERVFAINAAGTRNIAQVCRKPGCKMLYISTDYVFNGQGTEPWQPECEEYAPLNVYGQTKLEGEQAVKELLEKYFIVRIAWVFGMNGHNFVKTMLKLAKTHDILRIVNDQIGTPTYTFDLARLLVDMVETEKYGCYHATNEGGYISWADFAEEIFKQDAKLRGLPKPRCKVEPVTTAVYGLSKAVRPFNSRLNTNKLSKEGFTLLPDWRDALKRYLIDNKL